MEDDLDNLRFKLRLVGQEHVLDFWEELDPKEKKALVMQIQKIDFEQVNKRYENSKIDDYFDESSISPIPYVNASNLSNIEKSHYIKIGEDLVKKGKVAVISMAGGQRNKTAVIMDQKQRLN